MREERSGKQQRSSNYYKGKQFFHGIRPPKWRMNFAS
jgi:hypothetical protein